MRSIIASILFLLATIFFSIVSIPAAVIDRSGRSYLWLAKTWSKIFLALYGIRVVTRGTENIQPGKAAVYIANHSSYVDIPVLLASVPDNIRLVLRNTLTRIPIWGWALIFSPFLIIDRSNPSNAKRTLSQAVETIRRGAAVLLFPEGTRTNDGVMHEFKRGAFNMAANAGAIIVPVAVTGTFAVLPRTRKLPDSSHTVYVTIGAPLSANPHLTGRPLELELMARSEAALRALLSEGESAR
jgi:1-acyl-sn-glycerol-3-phosphate acyltransferase